MIFWNPGTVLATSPLQDGVRDPSLMGTHQQLVARAIAHFLEGARPIGPKRMQRAVHRSEGRQREDKHVVSSARYCSRIGGASPTHWRTSSSVLM
ncbi:MAG: hypothetical protein CM1200mP29_10050 [Verrucomicrobiota bacterium]|nr:MAG: hypothetical protein CM1200mP29_10050 [Verrucomicrobiota bacterium]